MSKGRFFCSASAIAALAAFGVSGQAYAQAPQAAGQTSSTEVGEVVVTGSFIRGTPEDAALPVDVITQEDLEKQGAPSTLELIKQMSVSSGVLGDTNQFDTRAQGSEGSGSINLRGLGASRTLVLMNGRRLAPNPFGAGASGIVDTNILPTAAIGRVEILKEGAAATYGSDAIGGVVNFITRTNFEGFEVGGSYKHIDGSKGDWDASALWGHAWDNGNVLLTAGYQHRSELKVIDRDFAVRPFAENDVGGFSGGSSVTAFAPIFQGPTGAWAPAGGFQLDNGCTPLGGVAIGGGLPACNFQFSQYDNLVEHETRFQLYGEFNADLAENHRLHVEALYAKTDMPRWKTSPSYLALQTPTARANPTVGSLTPALLAGYFVPANNPGLIAYRAANPTAIPAFATGVHIPGVRYRPLSFQGNPIFNDDGSGGPSQGLRQYEAYRVSASLRGDLPWGGIGYDVAATYSQEVARRTGYDTLVNRLQLALRGFGSLAADTNGCTAAETANFTTNAGNQALGCYFFNPFSNAIQANAISGQTNPGFNSAVANNPDLIRWFFPQLSTKQASRLFVVDAVLNGSTGIELAGGPVLWAAGVQFRNDVFESRYNGFGDRDVTPCIDTIAFNDNGCAGRAGAFLFLANASGADLDQQVYAAFAEASVPFTEDIQLQLAARYEDYNGEVGSTFNPKAQLRWQVADFLAIRGGVGTTFRAPPLTSLNPSTGTGFSFIAGSFRAIDFTGNPDLKPETADNYNIGVIFDVGGLNATIDYWRFDFKKQIVAEPSGAMVATMFPGNTNVNCGNPAFAGLQQRFTFQGACALANISRVASFVVNGPKLKTSGVDFLADYDFGEVFMGGNFRVGLSATYTIDYKLDDFEVGGVTVQRGYDATGLLNYQLSATPLPEWKGQAFAEWSMDRHNLRLTVTYIDSYHDQRADVPGAGILVPNAQTGLVNTKGTNIKSTTLVDLDYRVQLPWETTVTLSVDNILDEDPSFARLDLNYDPFTGNPLGRVFKISARKRF